MSFCDIKPHCPFSANLLEIMCRFRTDDRDFHDLKLKKNQINDRHLYLLDSQKFMLIIASYNHQQSNRNLSQSAKGNDKFGSGTAFNRVCATLT